jgi:hypothetical protein
MSLDFKQPLVEIGIKKENKKGLGVQTIPKSTFIIKNTRIWTRRWKR